jgi:transcriptional regulator with XRE-family HTH domain
MTDFSGEVRRFMAERGMSLRGLARAANYDVSYLSKVLNGRKRASPGIAARLDDVLGAGGQIKAAAATFNGSLSPGDRDRLDWTARYPGHADEAALGSLTQVLAAQRKAEDALGSSAVLQSVLAQLAVVGALAAEARGPLRPAVIDVAQQWAQFAGWLHLNLAEHRKSAARFRQALEHATEIGDHTMIATVLSFRGYAAWQAGQPGPVIGLAQAARQDPRVALSQRTYAAMLEGRGHALAGDAVAAERMIGEALELAGQLDGRPDQNRPWFYWYSPGFFQCQAGIALSQLAHVPRLRDRAASMLLAGYESLPGDEKLSDWAGQILVHLAHVYERSGDVGPACAVALDATAIMRRTGSARLSEMLRHLLAALAVGWPDDPRVAELREAVR